MKHAGAPERGRKRGEGFEKIWTVSLERERDLRFIAYNRLARMSILAKSGQYFRFDYVYFALL